LRSGRYKSPWMIFGSVAKPEAAAKRIMCEQNQEARLAWYKI
jgi:hypothetical protein